MHIPHRYNHTLRFFANLVIYLKWVGQDTEIDPDVDVDMENDENIPPPPMGMETETTISNSNVILGSYVSLLAQVDASVSLHRYIIFATPIE